MNITYVKDQFILESHFAAIRLALGQKDFDKAHKAVADLSCLIRDIAFKEYCSLSQEIGGYGDNPLVKEE